MLEVVHQGHGRDVGLRGQEDGGALGPVRRADRQDLDQLLEGHAVAAGLFRQDLHAPRPGPHQRHHGRAEGQRQPGAVGNLEQVRGDEGDVHQAQRDQQRRSLKVVPLPHPLGDHIGQQGVDEHRAGHSDAIGRGQAVRVLEHHQQHQHADHQQAVHRRHEDLARLGLGGALDVQARQQAQLHALLGHGEGAGDHRLAGDHGGGRGQDQDRPVGEVWDHAPERVQPRADVVDGAGVQDVSALAQVVEHQAGKDQHQPGGADRVASEVAHVGVERLRPRHRQEDAAQDHEADEAVLDQEADPIARPDGPEDRQVFLQVEQAQRSEHQEPDRRDRAEEGGHPVRALGLEQEQTDQDHRRRRQDVGREHLPHVRRILQTLGRREHRDRRGDDAVAVEQRCADDAQQEDRKGAAADGPLGQGHQGQGAALALVVGAHQEDDVLYRHDQGHGPDHQGDDAKDGALGRADLLGVSQGLAHGVQRTGADIAEDDADGAEGEGREALRLGAMAPDFWRVLGNGRFALDGRGGGFKSQFELSGDAAATRRGARPTHGDGGGRYTQS